MTEIAERPVAKTLADGFTTVREATGPDLEAVSERLLAIGGEYEGVDIPYFSYSSNGGRKSRVKISNHGQVKGRNSRFLRHLDRADVYETLEQLPALGGEFKVTATEVNPEDETSQNGARILAVRFDEVSMEEIIVEGERVRGGLAEAGKMPPQALCWIPLHPDLILAYVTVDTPDDVFNGMRDAAQEAIVSFEFTLQKARLLPRLDRQVT